MRSHGSLGNVHSASTGVGIGLKSIKTPAIIVIIFARVSPAGLGDYDRVVPRQLCIKIGERIGAAGSYPRNGDRAF